MKILVLKNKLDFTILDECQKVIDFYKTRLPFPVIFDFKDVSIPLGVKEYKSVQGFNPQTGLPAVVKYYGLIDYVKDTCRTLVKDLVKDEYDAVIFAWDLDQVLPPTDGTITSFTNFKPLYNNTDFIQLAVNSYLKNKDEIWG